MPTGIYERTEYHRKRLREGALRGKTGRHMKGRKLPKEWRENIGNEQRGDKNYFWKGGHYISNGYLLIWQPHHPVCSKDGYVPEHRLVMEKEVGRFLLRSESVHHINGIKIDNRIENLILFKNESEHQKHHWKLRKEISDSRDKT